MADVAAISVVTGGVVGVSGVVAGVYSTVSTRRAEDRRQQHDHELRDLEAVRDLLDQAAISSHKLALSVVGLYHAWLSPVHSRWTEAIGLATAAVQEPRSELFEITARLVIRLRRDHDCVLTLTDAVGLADEIERAVGGHFEIGSDPPVPQPPSPTEQHRKAQRVDDLFSAREAFLDAATDYVGAQLPSPRRTHDG